MSTYAIFKVFCCLMMMMFISVVSQSTTKLSISFVLGFSNLCFYFFITDGNASKEMHSFFFSCFSVYNE